MFILSTLLYHFLYSLSLSLSQAYTCIMLHTGMLEAMRVGWRQDNVESTGVTFVSTRVLWYLDAYHEKFSSRGIKIPNYFSQFQRYSKGKKRERTLTLYVWFGEHIKCLRELLMHPWFASRVFDVLHQDIENLVESMSK